MVRRFYAILENHFFKLIGICNADRYTTITDMTNPTYGANDKKRESN